MTQSTPADRAKRTRRSAADWEQTLHHLHAWMSEHGTTRVPQKAAIPLPDGTTFPLGSRLKSIRQSYRAGTLPAEQVQQLEQLPGWSWTVRGPRRATQPAAEEVPQEWAETARKILDKFHADEALSPAERTWLRRQQDAPLNPAQSTRLAEITELDPRTPYGAARTQAFADLLIAWMEDNDVTDVTAITRNDSATDATGRPVPLQKRILYYRARHQGREGSAPLSAEEAATLERVPGWRWTSTRGPHRPQ